MKSSKQVMIEVKHNREGGVQNPFLINEVLFYPNLGNQ